METSKLIEFLKKVDDVLDYVAKTFFVIGSYILANLIIWTVIMLIAEQFR